MGISARVWAALTVATVSSAIAASASAAAYQLTTNTYTQNFEGLSWSSQTSLYSDFGTAASGTEGWVCTSTSNNAIAIYASRNASSPKPNGVACGSYLTDASQDKAFGRNASGSTSYIGLFLVNSTGVTQQSVDIQSDIELWLKPTATPTTQGVLHYLVGKYDLLDTNVWNGMTFNSSNQLASFVFAKDTPAGTAQTLGVHLSNLDWAPGDTLVLRWRFGSDWFANDHVVGLDNISVSVPEPSIVMSGLAVAVSALARRPTRSASKSRG